MWPVQGAQILRAVLTELGDPPVAGAEKLRGRVLVGLACAESDLGWRLLDAAERLLPPAAPGALPGCALRAGQSAAAAPLVCFGAG
jgi:hypothetical protein